jgi:hypothetical protein
MVPSIVRTVALAGGLLLAPILIGQANAGHGFGGGHFGGMGGGHFGGAHFGGMGGARFGGMGHAHLGGMGEPRFASGGWHAGHVASRGFGPAWHGGPRHYAWNGGHNVWHGNGHGHDHDHFVHNNHFHDHFHNRVFVAGIGWWPGYYGYGYGYGGCGWLYQQAVYTGSPYWWNRYYACTGYY